MKNLLYLFFLLLPLANIQAQDCSNPASKDQMEQLHSNLAKQPFDEGKIKLIKEFLSKNCLLASDLAATVKKLNFEEDKIAIIKKAYSKIKDKENLNLVLAELEFETSKSEIKAFIKGLK